VELPTADNPAVLIHGDCLDVLADLQPGSVTCTLTDPPYGIALSSHGTCFRGMTAIVGDESAEVGQAALDLAGRLGPVLAFADPLLPWAGDWRQHLGWDKGPPLGSVATAGRVGSNLGS
jgi:hypothetical protein